jgi:hypothetical protein
MTHRYLSFAALAIACVATACAPEPPDGTGGTGGIIFHEGGAPGTGGAPTCAGCLTPTLVCEPGNTGSACGRDGQSCASCALPRASGACVEGACSGIGACDPMWMDCDGNAANGCETPMSDNGNCGACGVACEAPQTCLESCGTGPDTCSFHCG